ncbi:aminotransferase class I/II-fold pyridoxal phosphate-dependent enzyme [Phototrophicus methaneseepsis]|uniref:Aminotransferase n=1 Tax=Phototrophicus methaneseepsis TaxID=2710758 RepID=A0A7S8E8H8_9CHLR|nr:aminotransferase class I/II-fold pyridoxal phosphate-dependent enzyme [Phototrophicus methaneseepsis]QPC82331.1 aminotransferase class I/II-fold pyridoxal phosphate-dependent enzyme [Phototrophicus methaneseepsis]
MRNFVASTVTTMRASGIRKYFDIANQMEDVVTLGIGQPDFPTPQHITQAGIDSLQAGDTGYTANAGTLALRRAISAHIERLYGASYDPVNQVLVTVGVSEALFLLMKAILEPGDEVLIVEPCFVANEAAVHMAGGVAVSVGTSPEHDFQVTGAELEAKITPRTKAIFISYPNNPTGAILTREHMLQVAQVAEKYDLLVISDEIYERLVYGVEHINFATLPNMMERTVTLSGMSKSYAMTGWRIGYATGPTPIIGAMSKLHQYLIMSAPTTGQVAAIQALQHGEDDVEAMRQEYDRRRRVLVDGFNSLGLTCFEPRGAFYTFPSIASTGMSDDEFCERLLLEERLAVIPGSAFGQSGSGFVRASYASSMENIERALERLTHFMQNHGLLAQAAMQAII